MLKKSLIIFSIFVFTLTVFCLQYNTAKADTTLRSYKSVSLVKGSFLKAISLREVSTSVVKAGDLVYFINPCDVYIGETNVIPKDSVFTGMVESVVAAVEGVNEAMKIKIIKLSTTKGVNYNMDAYVYWKGTTTVGGDLSIVEYYAKMPHYTTSTPKGVLQLVPTSLRTMGEPRYLRAGEEVTFIINNDIPLFGN